MFETFIAPMETKAIFDVLTDLTNDLTSLLKLVVVLVMTIVLVSYMWSQRMGLKAIVIGLLAGAFTWWVLLGGGIETVGKLIQTQIDQASQSAPRLTDQPR